MSDFEDIQGKVYVVTGGAGAGAGGTGSAVCRALAAHGGGVAILDVADEAGRALAAELGDAALYVHCDVREPEEVALAALAVHERFGRVDGLVNNAFWHAGAQPPLHESSLADWDAHTSINLRCHFIVCHEFIPLLLEREKSVILNVSSTGAHRGEDGYFAYDAAKAGLESLTRNIAAQYGRQGLRCNCLAPGLVLSEGVDAALMGIPAVAQAFSRIDRNNLLFCGHGTGEDVAGAALFLLSDLSRYVTGQVLLADAGTCSHNPQWADAHE